MEDEEEEETPYLFQSLETRLVSVNPLPPDAFISSLIEGQKEAERKLFPASSSEGDDVPWKFYQKTSAIDCLLPLAEFVAMNNVAKLYIYPNYRPPLYTVPRGFVASFNLGDQFKVEPFLMQNLLRTVALYEIRYPERYVSLEERFKAASILRQCFPLESLVKPLPAENVQDGGWAMELGLLGGMIGIMKTRTEGTEEGHSHRYFIYVQSGLPRLMVESLLRDLESLSLDRSTVRTMEDVFVHHPQNLWQRSTSLAMENSHRLAWYFAMLLGLEPVHQVREYTTSSFREPSPDLLKKTFNPAQVEEVLSSLWPRGVPLNKASRLAWYPPQDTQVKEAPFLLPPLRDYPIGMLYHALPLQEKQTLMAKYGVRWVDHPGALEPVAFTSWNTYVVRDEQVFFYSETAPVPTDQKTGFIRPLSPIHGVQVYFSSAFPETVKDTQDYTWMNGQGNGLPISFQAEVGSLVPENPSSWAQQRLIFFDRFYGLTATSSTALPMCLRQKFPPALQDWCSGNTSFAPKDEQSALRSTMVKRSLFGISSSLERKCVSLEADFLMYSSPAIWEEGTSLDVFNEDRIYRSVTFT